MLCESRKLNTKKLDREKQPCTNDPFSERAKLEKSSVAKSRILLLKLGGRVAEEIDIFRLLSRCYKKRIFC